MSLWLFLFSSPVQGVDVEGVQPAALDQPRVNLHLRREAKGKPLSTKKLAGEETINIQAFCDTGASGIMLSKTTADALGVTRAKAGADDIVFHDIGVGGGDTFAVSEPLHVFIAASRASGEPADADGYPLSLGPVRAQIGPLNAGILETLTGGLDVLGMPAIHGLVMVIDPKPVDTFADTMRCGLFDPRAARDGKSVIPKTDRHIRVSYANFARFTHTTPPGATTPELADNPVIGPTPLSKNAAAKDIPPITVSFAGKSRDVSMLLDTGAVTSMISTKTAEALGVRYVEGTRGTNDPKLQNISDKDQFTFTVSGVGGSSKAAGFFLDRLKLPTRENDPIVYLRAPVLVTDITAEDPKTHEKFTFDGVFGMNYLVASTFITEGGALGLPDLGKMSQGPFEWIVFDEPAGELGVKLKAEFAKPAGGNNSGAGTIEIKPARPIKR